MFACLVRYAQMAHDNISICLLNVNEHQSTRSHPSSMQLSVILLVSNLTLFLLNIFDDLYSCCSSLSMCTLQTNELRHFSFHG